MFTPSYSGNLKLWSNKKQPSVVIQSELTECGLACLVMIADYYGYETNLLSLRKRFDISLKGSNLSELIYIAKNLNFTCRVIKLNINRLKDLNCPCILHWDLNHFVVLVKIKGNRVIIHDPKVGRKILSVDELSIHFSGIALELFKNIDFQKKKDIKKINLVNIFSKIQGFKYNIIGLSLLALLIELISLTNPFLLQWSIDKVVIYNDANLLSLLIFGFSITLLINRLIIFLQEWIALYFTSNLKLQLETSVFSKLLNLPFSFFQKRHLGDIISKFNSIHNIQSLFTTQFIKAFLDGVFALATFILMFIYNSKLSIIFLIILIIYILIKFMYLNPLRELTHEKIVFMSRKDTYFLESLRGIKSIQFFNKQSERLTQWLNTFTKEVAVDFKIHKLQIIFNFLHGLLFGIEHLIIIWIGIKDVLSGNITVGIFIAFITYKEQFKSKVNSLIDSLIQYKLLDIDKERISDIVLTEENNFSPKEAFNNQSILDNSVLIKNLFFKYSNYEKFILENINIDIRSNEFVVISGASGRGKTTLMNILANIVRPSSGEVLIGGISIDNLDLSNNIISMVSQDDTLYAGSILENIAFFDQTADLLWIAECAKMACIHDEIIQMPMGYETLVGDMGTVLSGGQKQRILIARALYFKPKILLFDEATSHLDAINEAKINSMLKALPITRICIAHRKETIEAADRVIYI